MSKPAAIQNLETRFWKHVVTVPECGCWFWDQSQGKARYGSIKICGRLFRAHRVSWGLYRGLIPEGMHVLHKCDIGFCVNPDHLFLGTHKENMDDRDQKGRGNQPSGDRHWSRVFPEKVKRGADHHSKRIPGWAQGEKNGRATLTAQQVAEIRNSHLGSTALGRQFGVSRTHIKRIRAGLAWTRT